MRRAPSPRRSSAAATRWCRARTRWSTAATRTRGGGRDGVGRVRASWAARREEYAVVRAKKQSALSSVRGDRHDLEGDLQALEAQQARITAALQRSAAGNGYNPSVAGPVRSGSG